MSADAMERLFRAHQHAALTWLRRNCWPTTPAATQEDAVMHAFERLAHKPDAFLDEDRVRAWLCVVALNYVRSGWKPTPLATDLNDHDHELRFHPDHCADDEATERAEVAAAFALPTNQARAVVCRMLGLSYREAQQACGAKTYRWVNRHTTEGRRALKARLA